MLASDPYVAAPLIRLVARRVIVRSCRHPLPGRTMAPASLVRSHRMSNADLTMGQWAMTLEFTTTGEPRCRTVLLEGACWALCCGGEGTCCGAPPELKPRS